MRFNKKIKEKFKELKISLIYLFGSYLTKVMNFQSDVDIGILFSDESYSKDKLDIYTELYKIFSAIFKEREVDIVFLNDAPLTLKFEVVTNGKPIYYESIDKHYEFKERVIKEYIDFKPLLDEQDNEILKRI
ncbi:MAG: type VII toxin-antitoxin system MntA family adenylyltransferase antitoxin [Caldisericia bacterium]